MARDGETPLARFARALVHEDGFTLGPPWLSDDGFAAFLPILRTAVHARRSVLAAEASDAVSAVDPGRLDRLTVRNDSSEVLFLPPGSLFRSESTASRATTCGVVLGPRSSASVDVKCVQASRPMVPGVSLVLDRRLAPARVCRALASRDQGRVWAVLGETVGPSEDLFAQPEHGEALETARGPAGRGPPLEPGQCGIVVLDREGVVAIEWFDGAESWRAVAQAVLDRYAGSDRPAGQPLWKPTVDPTAAILAAKAFVSELASRSLRPIAPSSWVGTQGSLQCTVHDGHLVHVIAFGAERPVAPHPGPASGPASTGALSDIPNGMVEAASTMDVPDADVAAAETMAEGISEEAPALASVRPQRRKVLTSGWDPVTIETLDRYATKEFRGERSAAVRFLVRQGLRAQGYLGPRPATAPGAEPFGGRSPAPSVELARAGLEARLLDLERIAETPEYAGWLRKRARLELERMASILDDDTLRAAAQEALDHLTPDQPPEDSLPQPEATEEIPVDAAPAPPPPPDVRALLRQAFAASAGGDYRQAVALFDGILKAESGHRTARLGRAVALRRAGKPQEALDDLDAVLRLEPRNAAALLARGQILQGRGDLEGALVSFDLLVEVAASDWDVWMARGDVLAKMGRNDDALRSYGEALRRNPDDPNLQARIRALELARVPAPPTTMPRSPMPAGIEAGQSYLIREPHHERSYALFRALASQKVPSLILTSRSRDVVRREVGVSAARIIGLSFSLGEDLHNPTQLASLIRTIERFVYDNQGTGVVLVDGLRDLVTNNGFRDTALAIERIHEAILQSQAILLLSMGPGDLAEREAALLERSLRLLP